MCPEVEAGNFTTVVQSVLVNVGKTVLKMAETLWKNSFIIAKDVWTKNVNFVVIAITFSEKKRMLYFIPLVLSFNNEKHGRVKKNV
jgi:hypothetical protein